ncbi:MAG TPA: PTS sugar transporter subunit IIA [candidate division Zixibacteria bacterium]
MQISKLLKPELIKLEMKTKVEFPADSSVHPQKRMMFIKNEILKELVDLLDKSGRVVNKKKLLLDFFNREKKATTGIGQGIAIPHIRSMQAREFILGFARSKSGYEFDSLDKKPVHLFFVMAAPPYEDKLYLKIFKALAGMLQYDYFIQKLLKVSTEYEVIRAIEEME